jgi:hypothetical protein
MFHCSSTLSNRVLEQLLIKIDHRGALLDVVLVGVHIAAKTREMSLKATDNSINIIEKMALPVL